MTPWRRGTTPGPAPEAGDQPPRLLYPWGSPGKKTGVGAIASPGDLPDPGIEPGSLESAAQAGGFFTTSTTWEAAGLAYE